MIYDFNGLEFDVCDDCVYIDCIDNYESCGECFDNGGDECPDNDCCNCDFKDRILENHNYMIYEMAK